MSKTAEEWADEAWNGHPVDEVIAAAMAQARAEERERTAIWLEAYAERMSGSHPANAGYIACHAAAEEIRALAAKPREGGGGQ
jgi:hypothetical protein